MCRLRVGNSQPTRLPQQDRKVARNNETTDRRSQALVCAVRSRKLRSPQRTAYGFREAPVPAHGGQAVRNRCRCLFCFRPASADFRSACASSRRFFASDLSMERCTWAHGVTITPSSRNCFLACSYPGLRRNASLRCATASSLRPRCASIRARLQWASG